MGGKHESQCLVKEFRVVSRSSARTDFLNALYIFYQSLRLCVLLLEAVQAESCEAWPVAGGGAAGRALLAALPAAASGAAARPLAVVLKGSEAAAGCSPRC